MEKIATEIMKLTWSELDSLARNIVAFATDDNDEPNDAHYIAQCLLEWADIEKPT